MAVEITDIAICRDAALFIHDQFEMDKDAEAIESAGEYLSALQKALAGQIAYMMEHEAERLKWILYRIDISEQKVLQALATQPLHEAVDNIARMIIDRQIQKAVTRKQYSAGKSEWSFDI